MSDTVYENALATKASPTSSDLVRIIDVADSNKSKNATAGSLLSAQTFAAAVSTNPYSSSISPRHIGDIAVNTTSLEVWVAQSATAAATSWSMAAPGYYGGGLVTDLTSIAISGFYTCYSGATGIPNSTQSWFIQHVNSNAGTLIAFQMAIGYTDYKTYYRFKAASTWGPWIGGYTPTELSYISGVTSSIQTQLNAKGATLTSIIVESTTARTLSLTDAETLINCTNASATTVTVPLNSSVAFPIGTHILIQQGAAGQVTVAATSGVTIGTTTTLKTFAQYAQIALLKTASDTWTCVGERASS